MDKPQLYLFQHIPKTAGTSLTYVVERQYRPQLLKWYTEEPNAVPPSMPLPKAAVGHFRYGFHRHFPQAVCSYFALMRNPIEQAFSHYHYLQKHPTATSAYLKEVVLDDFVHHPHGAQFQLRFLAGLDQIVGQEDHALEIAKANIATHYPVVGITEQFDDSLLVFAQHLEWKQMYYLKAAVNPTKPELPKRLCQLWEKPLAQEMELYEWVKNRFQIKLKEVVNLEYKRQNLNRNNAIMTRLSPWIVGLKKMIGKD